MYARRSFEHSALISASFHPSTYSPFSPHLFSYTCAHFRPQLVSFDILPQNSRGGIGLPLTPMIAGTCAQHGAAPQFVHVREALPMRCTCDREPWCEIFARCFCHPERRSALFADRSRGIAARCKPHRGPCASSQV